MLQLNCNENWCNCSFQARCMYSMLREVLAINRKLLLLHRLKDTHNHLAQRTPSVAKITSTRFMQQCHAMPVCHGEMAAPARLWSRAAAELGVETLPPWGRAPGVLRGRGGEGEVTGCGVGSPGPPEGQGSPGGEGCSALSGLVMSGGIWRAV